MDARQAEREAVQTINEDYEERFGFHDPENYLVKAPKGLTKRLIEEISAYKEEPTWMREFRLKAYQHYLDRPLPLWGGNLAKIDFDNIHYFVRASEKSSRSWDDVPEDIKNTFDRLGIPEAERKFLAGAGAQYESESIYHQIQEDLEKQGVIFMDMDSALREHEDLVRQYWATIIPPNDNKLAALNSAVWSGGSFVYIPEGVKVEMPLQAYFRINTENMGQFERTLIIAEEGSEVHYVEGCHLAGSMVRVLDGEKPIEEIEIDDKVLTHKGRFRSVEQVMRKPRKGPIYHIQLQNDSSRSLAVTPGHPFLVLKDRSKRPQWLTAQELDKNDCLAVPLSVDNEWLAPPVNQEAEETAIAVKDALRPQSASSALNTDDYLWMPISSITEIEAHGEVFNLKVEEDESYVCEGVVSHNCTAPVYSTDSLHSAVVEIIAKKNSRVRYTTVQNWSQNVFNLVTKRAVAHEAATMEWVDCNLGCLASGTRLTTPEGPKNIEDIAVGEEILSWDEENGKLTYKPVTAKKDSGYQKVRRISDGQRSILATSNHPFYSWQYNSSRPKKLGRYQLDYVRADEIDQVLVPRTTLSSGQEHLLKVPSQEIETEFVTRNQYQENLLVKKTRQSTLLVKEPATATAELMWLFGYFVGDGDIAKKLGKSAGVVRYASVGFSCPSKDRARNKLLETMSKLSKNKISERKDGVHLRWHGVELAEFFEGNGFVSGARKKRLPEWVYSLPLEQRAAFIAGYIDADGTVNDNRFVIRSASKPLLEDSACLLTDMGITSRLWTEYDQPKTIYILGKRCTTQGSYKLSFPLSDLILQHCSEDINLKAIEARPFLERKIGRSNIPVPDQLQVIKPTVSEESAAAVQTWDIEVADTGNFIADGYIVHNSSLTMKYPSIYLLGERAHGEVLSIAYAGKGQHQDAGAKIFHVAPKTTSTVMSKSISKDGGRATYRGLLEVAQSATQVKSKVVCDALLLDPDSRSDTYPTIRIDANDASVGHEASVSKVGEEQLYYLMAHGLSEDEAAKMIVNGFIEPVVRELPMEYAVELNRLIELQMEGSIG
jgi:Fe-S cluster assembly scaffold protein SufB